MFQLATTLVDEVVTDEPSPSVLEPLVAALLEQYPRNHLCVLVHSAAHLETLRRTELPLGDLARRADIDLWRRPTLYVPPFR